MVYPESPFINDLYSSITTTANNDAPIVGINQVCFFNRLSIIPAC